ncbi:hypothetical protein [Candidatus Thiodiazotropha sp. CDECU1]|uniref:hypothetical protein n=1 Tax=Candidatus Thiodiazotropha sp. CDECU1 TaxID=3065865 RepID=UPI0029313C3E|nr:hypothetical protein [Candidatus Thiodiazotropha sp. CDECU1]
MNIGGIVARAALLKEQMKKRPCKRCGLLYDPTKDKRCPHCDHLDQKGLEALIEKRKREHQGNKQLGKVFFFVALVIFMLMLILWLSQSI